MKKIVNDFIDGDSTKKLAIISDFATILGVSVATFVAGPFLSKFANQEFIITDFILSIAFYFICIYISVDILYTFIKLTFTKIHEKKYEVIMVNIPFALFVIWIVIVIFPYMKYYTGNSFNVSYLLSPTATSAIIKKEYIKMEQKDDIAKITGKLIFAKNTNSNDYVAIIYAHNKTNGLFEIIKYRGYSNDYQTIIRNSGEFTIPIKLYDNYNDFSVIVYRKSDWSLLTAFSTKYGFPNQITYLPNNEIDELQAFVLKIKPNKSLEEEQVTPASI